MTKFHQDPHGFARKAEGRTITAEGWQRVAGPLQHYWVCDRCSARLDASDGGQRQLTQFTSDPRGVGKQFQGKTLLCSGWARLAQGLPLTAGNCYCRHCRAEFNHDTPTQTLTLLNRGGSHSTWDAWRGKLFPLSIWYIAASGKSSLRPGWICSACNAEFDDEPSGLKAVRLPQHLSGIVNEVHSLSDWYRRARGAPTAIEERQLREESARLQDLKRQQESEAQHRHYQNFSRLEEELTRLVKQSLVEGFHPLQPQWTKISLREQETLHWEGAGRLFKQRTSRGNTYWQPDIQGKLLVTSERILLDSPQRLWQRPLSKLLRVDLQHFSEGPILVLWLDGLQRPVGLWGADLQVEVKVGDQTRTIKLDSGDLERLLQTLSKKGK